MKNKLLLLAVALLTSWSVKAVDVIEEGVDYYIVNVETGLFLGGQNSWGTQNSVSSDAGIYQFIPGTSGEGYNITNTLVRMGNKYLGTNLFEDNAGLATVKDDEAAGTTKSVDGIWSIEPQGGGIFAFKCVSEWKWENDAWVEIPHGYLSASNTPGIKKGFVTEFSPVSADRALFYVFTKDEAIEYVKTESENHNMSYSFLLKNPDKVQVFFHRKNAQGTPTHLTPEYAAEQARLLRSAEEGAVLVTPGISKGEQGVVAAALAARLPLILLQKEPITEFWKPPQGRFYACAEGRLLILAPWSLDASSDYGRFHALNDLARDICQTTEARILNYSSLLQNTP